MNIKVIFVILFLENKHVVGKGGSTSHEREYPEMHVKVHDLSSFQEFFIC
jgi:hypothetical protein